MIHKRYTVIMQNDALDPLPSPSNTSPNPQPPVVAPPPHHKRYIALIIVAVLAMLLLAGGVFGWMLVHKKVNQVGANIPKGLSTPSPPTSTAEPAVAGLQLDSAKNYGNKYADGLLPVGDNKYVTNGGQKGSIYLCSAGALVPASQAGAQVRGPWFTNNNTQWDIHKKAAIAGSVDWTSSLQISVVNGKRIITTNDLPNHHTGLFPVGMHDPARVYDANPNTISAQALTYMLAADPVPGTPQCIGGEVGVMTTGVALFDGFDAGGRDAGAWEVQDSCDGHPQNKGEYHYHTLSRCITDQSVQTIIGYALDGFAITGPKVGDNNFLTTSDLDECHGIVSQIKLNDKLVTKYHYVMTQDFPYSVSCFRAAAIQPPGHTENSPNGQPVNSPPPR